MTDQMLRQTDDISLANPCTGTYTSRWQLRLGHTFRYIRYGDRREEAHFTQNEVEHVRCNFCQNLLVNKARLSHCCGSGAWPSDLNEWIGRLNGRHRFGDVWDAWIGLSVCTRAQCAQPSIFGWALWHCPLRIAIRLQLSSLTAPLRCMHVRLMHTIQCKHVYGLLTIWYFP